MISRKILEVRINILLVLSFWMPETCSFNTQLFGVLLGEEPKLEEFQNKARRNFFPSQSHETSFYFLTESHTLTKNSMNLTYFLIHKSNIKIWHELSENHCQSDAMAAQFTYYVHKIAWHNWLNKLMEKYHREFWTHMAWNWFFNESLPNHHNPLMTRMVGLWPPFFTPQLFHSWMMMSLSYLTRLPKKSCLSNRILHFLTIISHNILKTNPIKIKIMISK